MTDTRVIPFYANKASADAAAGTVPDWLLYDKSTDNAEFTETFTVPATPFRVQLPVPLDQADIAITVDSNARTVTEGSGTPSAGQVVYSKTSGYFTFHSSDEGGTASVTMTPFGNVLTASLMHRILADLRTAAAGVAGLGTIATQDADSVAITGGSVTGITDLAIADGGTGASSASVARTNLGLAIGTNVQAYDAGLQSLASLTTTTNDLPYAVASDTYSTTTLSAFGRTLIDDADAATARATLGAFPSATCVLVNSDGTSVAYNAASNSDAAAGTALLSAQTAAGSGDTIYVYRSALVTSSLGKDGVNWWFAPGVTISADGISIWSDGGSPIEYTVGGFGSFETGASGLSIVRLTAGSTVTIYANQMLAPYSRVLVTEHSDDELTAYFVLAQSYDGTFDNVGGVMRLYGERAVSTDGHILEGDEDAVLISHVRELRSTADRAVILTGSGTARIECYNAVIVATGLSTDPVVDATASGTSILMANVIIDAPVNDIWAAGGEIVLSNVRMMDGSEPTILAGASGGSVRWLNGTFNDLSVVDDLTVGGDATVTGALTANGNTTLGNANTDTVTVNGTASFPNATSSTYGVTVGGAKIFQASSGVLETDARWTVPQYIGVPADTDLLSLSSGSVTVNGTLAATALTASAYAVLAATSSSIPPNIYLRNNYSTAGASTHGVSVLAQMLNSVGAYKDAGRLDFQWIDNASTSEDAGYKFRVMTAGAAAATVYDYGVTTAGRHTFDNALIADVLALPTASSAPTSSDIATGEGAFFIKGGILYMAYNDSGTVRYNAIFDLTTGGTTPP